jgi:hypothetical protein
MKWLAAALTACLVVIVASVASAAPRTRADDLQGRCASASWVSRTWRAEVELRHGHATERWAILRAGVVRSVAKTRGASWEVRRLGVGLPQIAGREGRRVSAGQQELRGRQEPAWGWWGRSAGAEG